MSANKDNTKVFGWFQTIGIYFWTSFYRNRNLHDNPVTSRRNGPIIRSDVRAKNPDTWAIPISQNSFEVKTDLAFRITVENDDDDEEEGEEEGWCCLFWSILLICCLNGMVPLLSFWAVVVMCFDTIFWMTNDPMSVKTAPICATCLQSNTFNRKEPIVLEDNCAIVLDKLKKVIPLANFIAALLLSFGRRESELLFESWFPLFGWWRWW